MGQNMTACNYKPPKGEEINRNHFEFLYIIGKGGFGKVWRVIHKKLKTAYALKEMQKVKVIDKRSDKAIKYERELLSHMSHPFIVNMYYSFQDCDNLYLVMDLLTGGDLRYHVSRHRLFSEEQTKFFVACIILALEYIHSKNIIHRDIKPENLVLDEKGYVRLTDFGIAKLYSTNNSNETSGTPGYMSPEVMTGKNHTFAVDYFALGVMGYEFMLGRRPYVGKTRKEIKEKMMAKQACIKENEIPLGWNPTAAEFFNKLLLRKAEGRLGYKGIKELKDHLWIRDYDWKALLNKEITAPFIPAKRDNFDKRYCGTIDKNGYETEHRYEKIRNIQGYSNIFLNYTFYKVTEEEHKLLTSNNSITYQDNPKSSTPYVNSKTKKYSSSYYSTEKKKQSNIQSLSINLKQLNEEQSFSKNSLSTTKRDLSKNIKNTPRSPHNLIKKSNDNIPKSPLTKDNYHIKKTFNHKITLSPMTYKYYENRPICSSSSSCNLIKPELTKNTKIQTQRNVKQEFSSNLIKKMQNQKNVPTNKPKQIQRSNSTIINHIPINPIYSIKQMKSLNTKNIYISDVFNNKPSNTNSLLTTNRQNYLRKSNSNTNQIIIDNSFDIQQAKYDIKKPVYNDSINFLFKHYKVSSVSSNSTGSSSLSINKAHLTNK